MADYTLYDNFMELVKRRRNIRQFKSDPVPEEYIEKIIEAARWAPSAFHTQPWEFLVIKNKELKNKICDIIDRNRPSRPIQGQTVIKMSGYRNAPVFIILLGDMRAKAGLPAVVLEHADRVSQFFCSSLAGAFLYMHLAAASLGLSSQWYSSAADQKVEKEIKKLIGIPGELYIYDMMVVGYTAHPPVPKITRKLEDMIHYDDCGMEDFRTQAKVQSDFGESKAWCISAH